MLDFLFQGQYPLKNHFPQENPPKRNELFGIVGRAYAKANAKCPGYLVLTI